MREKETGPVRGREGSGNIKKRCKFPPSTKTSTPQPRSFEVCVHCGTPISAQWADGTAAANAGARYPMHLGMRCTNECAPQAKGRRPASACQQV